MATAALNLFNCYTENITKGVHNLQTAQLKVALTSAAPIATNTVLANLTEADYTYASTRNLTTTSAVQTSGTTHIIVADLEITATGGSVGAFRYVTVYDSTAAGSPLIGWYDIGSSITLADTQKLVINLDNSLGFLYY